MHNAIFLVAPIMVLMFVFMVIAAAGIIFAVVRKKRGSLRRDSGVPMGLGMDPSLNPDVTNPDPLPHHHHSGSDHHHHHHHSGDGGHHSHSHGGFDGGGAASGHHGGGFDSGGGGGGHH